MIISEIIYSEFFTIFKDLLLLDTVTLRKS